ncbi:MAG TPA: hypothetical protein DER68_03070 [Ruminococcaceae bacterium]|nr:hypothetical protein [Oscillospiraceae bacterium]
MEFSIYTVIAFVVYALIILGIGIYSFKKSKSVSDFFLGGRQLGSWTTAISAQASDMSGWLLMGLPGAVLIGGLTESWIAIGLLIGTYLNWKICASRLRKMSYAAGDAITIPEYFQKRFFNNSPVVRFICAVIIFFFFLIYTASAFSGGAKLFQFVFGTDYIVSLSIGAFIIISYTFLGGFLAVCWTDVVQGLLMFAALVVVPIVILVRTPDIGGIINDAMSNGIVAVSEAQPCADAKTQDILNEIVPLLTSEKAYIFSGELKDTNGNVKFMQTDTMTEAQIYGMDWYVQGVKTVGSFRKPHESAPNSFEIKS